MDIRTFTHLGLSNDGTIYYGLLSESEGWVTLTQAEMVHYTATVQKVKPGETIEVISPLGTMSWLPWVVLSAVGVIIVWKSKKRSQR